MRMRSLTDGQHLGEGRVAAGQREPDVEVLVDEHELGVGVLGGIVLERYPVAAQVEQRRTIVGHAAASVRSPPWPRPTLGPTCAAPP